MENQYEYEKAFSTPIEGFEPYTPEDFTDIIQDMGTHNAKKPIIVEACGERIPIKHVYTVSQDLVDEGAFSKEALGCLVVDLDI